MWVVSLDLSKTFDRVSWTQLWRTLKAHGVWIIQCLYWQQRETRVRTNFNSEYYPLVALARVPGPATSAEVQKSRSDTLAGSCGLSVGSPSSQSTLKVLTVDVKAGA